MNASDPLVIVAVSGGVDSAVAAACLLEQGYRVQAMHMTNWEEDDGYCGAADDRQTARSVCRQLGITLHEVNFAREYREQVFTRFLDDYSAGRTPNPDVLCNREIKFGVFLHHARRLGADLIATGHYARLARESDGTQLLCARDTDKDQTYFLHAVPEAALERALFPLGDLTKTEVRLMARDQALGNHDRRDSTGICFIGERPFRQFLSSYLDGTPGAMLTPEGRQVGEHCGLMHYTRGQRRGLGIGGRRGAADDPWYVAGKNLASNVLYVVQGRRHPALWDRALVSGAAQWVAGRPPRGLAEGPPLALEARTRYRQTRTRCQVGLGADGRLRVCFDRPQWCMTPGQYVVFYQEDRCLGGAPIEQVLPAPAPDMPAPLRQVG